jgi:rRNA processing protein Gar1
MEFIGFTIDVVGKIMIAYTAIAVHYRFWKEHKVDESVFKSMKKERLIGIMGIILIIIGFFLQAPFKL